MRIGIDARFYGTLGKGLGRYTEKLISTLEAEDTENEYVVFLSPENYAEYQPENPRFRKALSRSRWYGFSEQLFYPLLLLRHRLDLVHFPHFNVPVLYRRPFVCTIHDLILFHFPTQKATTRSRLFYRLKLIAYRFVLGSALRRARRVITVSHFTKADILRHYPQVSPKISVTYEAAEAFCAWLPEPESRRLFAEKGLISGAATGPLRDILSPYILYVGNAYPHKNLELIIALAGAFPEYRFVLVGKEDYFYRRLKKEAATAPGNVVFAGGLSDRELGAFYRFARLYLFPSFYEGFGLPPLEAMQYGTPVLSSDAGSLPEILGSAARYFDPRDADGAAEALRALLADPIDQERCRTLGRKQAERYSWERMGRETLAVYREASRQKHKEDSWHIHTNHQSASRT